MDGTDDESEIPLLPERPSARRISPTVRVLAIVIATGALWLLVVSLLLPHTHGALRYVLEYFRIGFVWLIVASLVQETGLLVVTPRLRVAVLKSLAPRRFVFWFHLAVALFWLGVGAGLFLWLRSGNELLFAILFAGYFVVQDGYRAARSLRFRQLSLDATPRTDDAEVRADIVHFTDLHLTATDDGHLLDLRAGQPGGNKVLRALVRTHRNGVLKTARALLVTGDATDSGTEDQWQTFFRILGAPELTNRMVLVPGNHELNIPRDAAPGMLNAVRTDGLLNYGPRRERALRCLLALDRIQGSRARVLARIARPTLRQLINGGGTRSIPPCLTTLSQYLSDGLREIDSFRPGRPPYASWSDVDLDHFDDHVDAIVAGAYPMVVEVPGAPFLVLVLDSTSISANTLSNAFGEIGAAQLERLDSIITLLLSKSRSPIVVAMHHHMGEARGFLQRAMGIVDADDLLAVLRRLGPTVLFNGPPCGLYWRGPRGGGRGGPASSGRWTIDYTGRRGSDQARARLQARVSRTRALNGRRQCDTGAGA